MDALNNLTDTQGTGLRGIGLTIAGTPLLYLMKEEWAALLFIAILVIADNRFARLECALRRAEAEEAGEPLPDKFKWRTSRALRRTANKFVNGSIFCALGLCFGVALIEPLGYPRYLGTLMACAYVAAYDIKSLAEHYHHIKSRQENFDKVKSGAWAFLKSFAVFLAKKKNEEVGEALEEALNAAERKTE
jgi:hypothetical protein